MAARECKGRQVLNENHMLELANDVVKQALAAGVDIVMLDNMALDEMKRVVDSYAGRIPIEVSGNVTLERAREIAAIGVDFISVGALTHSAKALDISLEFLS